MLKIGEIVQTLKGIVETRVGMVKQEIQEEFLNILSRLILLVLIGSMLLLVILFFSLSFAFYLSSVTKSPFLGFLIVGLIYLLAVVGLYLSKDSQGIQDKTGGLLKDFIFKFKKRNSEDE